MCKNENNKKNKKTETNKKKEINLYCNICKKKYISKDAYNTHLQRRLHYITLTKYEVIYGQDTTSNKYKAWSQLRDEATAQRT